MLVRLHNCAATVIVLLAGMVEANAQTSDSIEPPLQYQLKLGDKTQPISEGVPAIFEGSYINPSATLEVAPERAFPYGGIRFSYPRHYTFEADFTSPDIKIWTVSGNNFKIMYFVSDQELTAEALLEGMAAQLGEAAPQVETSPASLPISGQTLNGTRGTIQIAIQKLTNDAFTLPLQGGKSRVLLFQDALKDSGEASDESGPAIALLSKSLVIEP